MKSAPAKVFIPCQMKILTYHMLGFLNLSVRIMSFNSQELPVRHIDGPSLSSPSSSLALLIFVTLAYSLCSAPESLDTASMFPPQNAHEEFSPTLSITLYLILSSSWNCNNTVCVFWFHFRAIDFIFCAQKTSRNKFDERWTVFFPGWWDYKFCFCCFCLSLGSQDKKRNLGRNDLCVCVCALHKIHLSSRNCSQQIPYHSILLHLLQ